MRELKLAIIKALDITITPRAKQPRLAGVSHLGEREGHHRLDMALHRVEKPPATNDIPNPDDVPAGCRQQPAGRQEQHALHQFAMGEGQRRRLPHAGVPQFDDAVVRARGEDVVVGGGRGAGADVVAVGGGGGEHGRLGWHVPVGEERVVAGGEEVDLVAAGDGVADDAGLGGVGRERAERARRLFLVGAEDADDALLVADGEEGAVGAEGRGEGDVLGGGDAGERGERVAGEEEHGGGPRGGEGGGRRGGEGEVGDVELVGGGELGGAEGAPVRGLRGEAGGLAAGGEEGGVRRRREEGLGGVGGHGGGGGGGGE